MATKKVSVQGAARDARREEKALVQSIGKAFGVKNGTPQLAAATIDSFVNFAHKLGMGADNLLTSSTYGFNPISRNRTLLEWIHRGSWLGGMAVDLIADDMTRAGADYVTELEPEAKEAIDEEATTLKIWDEFNATIKWGRLYGGAICVALIDGQDTATPLRLDAVGPKQFRGCLTLDRWMIEPSLGDLVTDLGPNLGTPKYYRVLSNAPALRGQTIHYSRVLIRSVGIKLPYQQALMENLWGVSVLERLYDRMVGYDMATAGITQLISKAALRTLKVKDMRQVVAAGGKALDGLTQYTELMRRYQGIEGVTMIDGEDDFELQGSQAFSGLGETLLQLAQQFSGGTQIPLVRLLGQSPAGLNSTGESDLRTYYDGINQKQVAVMNSGVHKVYLLLGKSEGFNMPKNFKMKFKSLWQLDDKEKADISDTTTRAVGAAYDSGLIGRQTALRELRQSANITGIFTNITNEMIAAADDEVQGPLGAEALQGLMGSQDPDQKGAETDENKPGTEERKVQDETKLPRRPVKA